MSDSVDRVFSHALNTVNKIRTGSEKPPASVRLRLYGLYKQSMEGDVDGIMDKPTGSDESSRRAREKWEAWHAQAGLSRTEAKRRYIGTLIDTMHKYASSSAESRELVSELEFVWDQVKSNVPSSNSSSPARATGMALGLSRQSEAPAYGAYDDRREGMQVLSPVSREQLELEAQADEEAAEDDDQFVDAPDSQVDAGAVASRNIGDVLSPSPSRRRGEGRDTPPGEERRRKRKSYPPPAPPPPSGDEKWKKSISASIIKLTAELAAVREQLEARRLFNHTLKFRVLRFITTSLWGIIKHIAIDAIIVGAILLWLRRRKDKRVEGAVRVLLGDAVAQVQEIGARAQLGKIQLPMLNSGGKK